MSKSTRSLVALLEQSCRISEEPTKIIPTSAASAQLLNQWSGEIRHAPTDIQFVSAWPSESELSNGQKLRLLHCKRFVGELDFKKTDKGNGKDRL